ncbi:MAG TPA: hypothetical protein VFC75_03930, partial [Erysipelothrix sp.]|nr:hypothetical protein [Erysipelothrix sp.]
MKKRTTQALIISIITFMIFYILIRFVLGNDLDLENILAMLIYSLIVGLIGFAMNHFNLKIAYTLFLVGHFFGLGFMGYAYMSDVSG